jgi:hypothetical protein
MANKNRETTLEEERRLRENKAEAEAAVDAAFANIIGQGTFQVVKSKEFMLQNSREIPMWLMEPRAYLAGPESDYGWIENMSEKDSKHRSRVRKRFRVNNIKRLWDIANEAPPEKTLSIFPDICRSWEIYCEANGMAKTIPAVSRLIREMAKDGMEKMLLTYPGLEQELPGAQKAARKRERSASSTRSVTPSMEYKVSANYKGTKPWTAENHPAKHPKISPTTQITGSMLATAIRKQKPGPQRELYSGKENYSPHKSAFKKPGDQPNWSESFKPVLCAEMLKDNLKLIMMNNEQYVLSGTQDQLVMDRFVITGTTITEPVVTVPWRSLNHIIRRLAALEEDEPDMKWSLGITVRDGLPTWEKNTDQTNGIWTMTNLMTELNKGTICQELQTHFSTHTGTTDCAKNEQEKDPEVEILSAIKTAYTGKPMGRGIRPPFQYSDSELKQLQSNINSPRARNRNTSTNVNQGTDTYEPTPGNRVRDLDATNELEKKRKQLAERGLIPPPPIIAKIFLIPKILEKTSGKPENKLEKILVSNITVPTRTPTIHTEQEPMEVVEEEPMGYQGNETFDGTNILERGLTNTVQAAPVQQNVMNADSTFGPTTKDWSESIEEPWPSPDTHFTQNTSNYSTWIIENPLPVSVGQRREVTRKQLQLNLEIATTRAMQQVSVTEDMELREPVKVKTEQEQIVTDDENRAFIASLSKEERYELQATEKKTAERIALEHSQRIEFLKNQLEELKETQEKTNAAIALCNNPAQQVNTECPEPPKSPQPCAKCEDVTQGYINIPQHYNGIYKTIMRSKCRHRFCEAKGSPLPLEAYDPTNMLIGHTRQLEQVLDELKLTRGRFKLEKNSIHPSNWSILGGQEHPNEEEFEKELIVTSFHDAWIEEGNVCIHLIKPTAQDLITLKELGKGKKTNEDAFTWFIMMAPNKHKLAVRVNYNGHTVLGHRIPENILAILNDPNITKLMGENVEHNLQKLKHSHRTLTPNWVNVGNAQIIAAPTWGIEEPPRDLFAMARTVGYKHPYSRKELSKMHSEEAYTIDKFQLLSPRMKAYFDYALVIPYAVMYKVVARSMELAGLSKVVDVNQPMQWFCDLLKEKRDFVKSNPKNSRPYPTEFMVTDSYTDVNGKTHKHVPYIFGHHNRPELLNLMPTVIAQRSRRRFFKPDMNYMPKHILEKFNSRQSFNFENGNEAQFVNSYINALAKSHPHQCEKCMSAHHEAELCDKASLECHYCKSLDRPDSEYTEHNVGVCPRLNCTYCEECQIAGHDPSDHPGLNCVTAISKFNFWRRLGTFSSKLFDPETCYQVVHTRNPEDITVTKVTKNAAIELQLQQCQAQNRAVVTADSRLQTPPSRAKGAPNVPRALYER